MKVTPLRHSLGAMRKLVIYTTVGTFLATPPYALGAQTDLANVPVASSGTTPVPPNVLFILDDSGSMDSTFMPEEAQAWDDRVGGKSSSCNRLYYNPATTFSPPVNADGTSRPSAAFASARTNGFDAGSNAVNLAISFQPNQQSATEPAYYYRWTGAGQPTAADCNAAAAGGSWLKVVVAGTAEETNFANWFSFYRTRLMAMKTAAGQAFVTVNENYRVGFITICPDSGSGCDNDGTTVDGTKYLRVDNFNAAHKAAWYNILYAQDSNGRTPLREALSRAGRYFANVRDGINNGINDDPMQYSCQKNFAILTTDGYWNSGNGRDLAGAVMTNQDNNQAVTPRPMFDGAVAGASNTLADVAEYYYRTDLRTPGRNPTGALGVDVATNATRARAGSPEDDTATHQHMTTFTVGLGVSGTLPFDPNYRSQTTGVFQDLRTGAANWPNPGASAGNADNNAGVQAARIDDLWHAAVNGRGRAFSASNPTTLGASLQSALAAIQSDPGAGAAVATSNIEPRPGDNLVFSSSYTTGEWTGDLRAFTIDVVTNAGTSQVQVSQTNVWARSAQEQLDTRVGPACDNRNIKTFRPGTGLVDFTWDTASCAAGGAGATGLDATEQDFFSPTQAATFTQWGLMTDGTSGTANQRGTASGANLVNFLRGQRGKEGFAANDLNRLYRERVHVLGDIVNGAPAYVAAPFFNYADAGYAAFKAGAAANRKRVIYAPGNDGMLHAFHAGTPPAAGSTAGFTDGGGELWAYIPRMVLPRLHKLADINWANLHEFLVDGSPVVGDVLDPATNAWHTILVAGLNKGGRGYYALDITDPDNPRALWEFGVSDVCYEAGNRAGDCNMGFSYGNPVITKLKNGSWVVMVTSGLNNVGPGDGQGYLYVLDALTGQAQQRIATGVGGIDTPSGLNKIRNWVVSDPNVDATTDRVYGVDLLGNIFRFDVNTGASTSTAGLLATLKDAGGNPQPLTTRPELAEVGSPPAPYVYIATGQYLGLSDVTTRGTQSVYGIKDPLTGGYGDTLRANLNQVVLNNADPSNRTVECEGACASQNGWYVDLPVAGERVNVDVRLQLGSLVVVSNVPSNSLCEGNGASFLNFFNFATGLAPGGADATAGFSLPGSLGVGFTLVKADNGQLVAVGKDSKDAPPSTNPVPIQPGGTAGKRITWRELAP